MKDRHVKVADIEAVVKEIYEKYKTMEPEGAPDPRMKGVDAKKFGISVVLADGTEINVGDTDVASPLGRIAYVPLMSQIRIQKEAKADKNHTCKCALKDHRDEKPHHMPVSVHGVRMMSLVEPVGDPEGKWDIAINLTNTMAGSPLTLNDELYKSMMLTNQAADVENAMAKDEFYLYDDAPMSIDLYTRLTAMQATTRQLARMGATLANGGQNPVSGEYAFDSKVSPKVVAFMAAKGPHHMSAPWLVKSGIPAENSFGGAMMAVFPGVMGIAAYSPVVNDFGVSVIAFKAIHHIMKHLGINVFGGENIIIDK